MKPFIGTPNNPRPVSRIKDIADKKAGKIFKRSLYFLIACFILVSLYTGYDFVQTHNFRSPVVWQNPTPRKEAKIIDPTGKPKKTSFIPKVQAEELTDEQYICQTFGKACKTAVAINKAESGMRADAINKNNNGTIDVGCWQVNSIHLGQAGLTLATLLDCKKATDWVFENLYQEQGWTPWVAYNSGAYLAKL